MTADTQELAALWAAIDAMPECQLRRGVLADFLDERAGVVACGRCKGCVRVPCPSCIHWKGRVPKVCSCAGDRWVLCPTCNGTGFIPDGRADLARALRATADRVPFTSVPQAGERAGIRYWAWVAGASDDFKDTAEVRIFDRLAGEIVGDHTNFRDYPTASAAIRDLCRAYIAVHCKSEVTA